MVQTKPLDAQVWVAAQVYPDDLPQMRAAGIRTVIGNRPDGEAPDQPLAAEMAAAATALGLDYVHLPVVGGAIEQAQVEAFGAALAAASGPVLAFCRSGMRSATLWAHWQARHRPLDEILAATARAGYALTTLGASAQASPPEPNSAISAAR